MKHYHITLAITLWILSLLAVTAQTNDETEEKKQRIVQIEKEALTNEVEKINDRLTNNELTFEEAETLKKEAATKHALNIENKVAILENTVALKERNGEPENSKRRFSITFGDDEIINEVLDTISRERKRDIRTYSGLTFAFGLNNAIASGRSLDDAPYKIGGSKFAELGISWSTRVFEQSNWLRVRYGLSFQFNGLKAENNQFFVENGNQTELQEYPLNYDKQKLRLDNLVVPFHFEFGPSKKIDKDTYFRYNTSNSFRVGLGGYAGVNLTTIQKLKFEEDGADIKVKNKNDFNTNNFIYGLSGYIGWGDTSLYVKYDLNPIFKDNPVEEHNVSLGIRFDFE